MGVVRNGTYYSILLGITLLAWIVRLTAADAAGGLAAPLERRDGLDQLDYEEFAWQLSQGHGYVLANGASSARRPPGTSLAILPAYLLYGRSYLAARLLFTALSASICWAAAWLLKERHGARCALLAAGCCALDPALVIYSFHLVSETPFILVTTLATGFSLRALRAARTHDIVWGGVLWGFAALIRPQVVLVAPLGLCFILLLRPPRWTTFVGVLTAQLAVGALSISPWLVRNYFVMGKLCIATLVGGHTFWGAHNPVCFEDPAYRGSWVSITAAKGDLGDLPDNELEQEAIAWREGWAIVSERIQDLPSLLIAKLYRLITPFEDNPNRLVYWSLAIFWICTVPLATRGMSLIRHQNTGLFWSIAIQILATMGTTLFFYGCARFRHGLEAQLLALVAVALDHSLQRKLWTMTSPAAQPNGGRPMGCL